MSEFFTHQSADNSRALVAALMGGGITAFIGAGLSAPSQPTWSRLHADLQREAGLESARSFDPAFAPADFADFRDALGTERYLAILKARFGGIVAARPPLYRVVDETRGFEQLVTTNYDEYLASAAHSSHRQPRIAAYPALGDLGARYVYLHGRARTAANPTELVLCEDDYGRAYETPGWARDMLNALFLRPGVFVAMSLGDPDLLHLLRRRHRVQPKDGTVPELPALFAIVPVEASGTRGAAGESAAAAVAERRLDRLGVRAICYARDRGHTQLRAVLLQLQHDAERRPVEPVFLDRTRRLNRLGATASPSAAEVDEVVETIGGVPELARHFFRISATSPAWYDVLKESVVIPGVVEPWSLGDGGRMIGPWAAAPYVARLAPERPAIVEELIERLADTENWQAQAVLSRLAAELPNDSFGKVMPALARWMGDADGAADEIADDLATVPNRLSAEGHSTSARRLLGYLLLPSKGKRAGRSGLRVHDYRFPELRTAIDRQVAQEPGPTYSLLKTRLLRARSATGGEGREAASSWWRAAIEDHEQNLVILRPALHFLLDATRDALNAWIARGIDPAVRELDRLLASGDGLLERLALHVLTVHPDLIARLRTPVLTDERFWDDEVFHELATLLGRCFGILDDGARAKVHRLVAEGPPAAGTRSEDERAEDVDYGRWRWLAVIPFAYQTAEEQAWWERLRQTKGERAHPLFLVWHGGMEMEEERVEGVDEAAFGVAWREGRAPALAAALRSSGGGWGPLADLVREDPVGLVELAPSLGLQDGDRLSSYFGAYAGLLGNRAASLDFAWEPLVDLMERSMPADPSAATAAMEIARLVEEGVASEANPIPADLLARTQDVAAGLLDRFAQPLATDPARGGRLVLHHQLNHVAGRAADAYMRVVWQQLFLGKDEPRRLPDGAEPRLDAAVETGWGGLELRHALGEFWFVVDWGEPGWLARHVGGLWPDGDAGAARNARRAFLIGYLQAHQWSRTTLSALLALYGDVVADLAREPREYLDEPQLVDPFLRHLVLGWLHDVDGFAAVLGAFLTAAPDGERARFVRLLGREYLVIDIERGPDFGATIKKRETFWERRVTELGPSLPATERSEELSAFCSWARTFPRSLARLESRLRLSVDHLAGGQGAIDALLDCVAARGEGEPLPAARLLLRLVDRLFGDERLQWGWHRDKLGDAIDAICRGALPGHRVYVRQAVNRLIQAEVADFSDKLDGCGIRGL